MSQQIGPEGHVPKLLYALRDPHFTRPASKGANRVNASKPAGSMTLTETPALGAPS